MIPSPSTFHRPTWCVVQVNKQRWLNQCAPMLRGQGQSALEEISTRSCRVLLAGLPSLSFSSSLNLLFHDVLAQSLSLLIWVFAVCLNFTLPTRVHRPTHMLSKAG